MESEPTSEAPGFLQPIPHVATSIFAANGNIYVGGYYNNGSGYVGCYWLIDANGVTKTDLPGTGANVNAIFVSGGTIYMAGYYNNGYKRRLLLDRSWELPVKPGRLTQRGHLACHLCLRVWQYHLCRWTG